MKSEKVKYCINCRNFHHGGNRSKSGCWKNQGYADETGRYIDLQLTEVFNKNLDCEFYKGKFLGIF